MRGLPNCRKLWPACRWRADVESPVAPCGRSQARSAWHQTPAIEKERENMKAKPKVTLTPGQKAAMTRKRRAAGRKAGTTRKRREAARKAAVTRAKNKR
jgi:hypothetical protein